MFGSYKRSHNAHGQGIAPAGCCQAMRNFRGAELMQCPVAEQLSRHIHFKRLQLEQFILSCISEYDIRNGYDIRN